MSQLHLLLILGLISTGSSLPGATPNCSILEDSLAQLKELDQAPPGYLRIKPNDHSHLGSIVRWTDDSGTHEGLSIYAGRTPYIIENGKLIMPSSNLEFIDYVPSPNQWKSITSYRGGPKPLTWVLEDTPYLVTYTDGEVLAGKASLETGERTEALELVIRAPNGVTHRLGPGHLSNHYTLFSEQPIPPNKEIPLPETPVVLRDPPIRIPPSTLAPESEADLRRAGVSEVYTEGLDEWNKKLQWIERLRRGADKETHVEEIVEDVRAALDYAKKVINGFSSPTEKTQALTNLRNFEQEAATRIRDKKVTPTWWAVFHRRLGPLMTQRRELRAADRFTRKNVFLSNSWKTHEMAMRVMADEEYSFIGSPRLISQHPSPMIVGTINNIGIIAFNETFPRMAFPAQAAAGRSEVDNLVYYGDQFTEHEWTHMANSLIAWMGLSPERIIWAHEVMRRHIRSLRGAEREEFEFAYNFVVHEDPRLFPSFVELSRENPFEFLQDVYLERMEKPNDLGAILPKSLAPKSREDRHKRLIEIAKTLQDKLKEALRTPSASPEN